MGKLEVDYVRRIFSLGDKWYSPVLFWHREQFSGWLGYSSDQDPILTGDVAHGFLSAVESISYKRVNSFRPTRVEELVTAQRAGMMVPPGSAVFSVAKEERRGKPDNPVGGRTMVKPFFEHWEGVTSEKLRAWLPEVYDNCGEIPDDVMGVPQIRQRYIVAKEEIRAYFIAGEIAVFNVRKHGKASLLLETSDVSVESVSIPPHLRRALEFVMSELNLEFGAFDLVRDARGAYFFLEVNPSASWIWLDRIVRGPIKMRFDLLSRLREGASIKFVGGFVARMLVRLYGETLKYTECCGSEKRLLDRRVGCDCVPKE